MTSREIRESFLNFFKNKEHHIMQSAPMVIKNDPTLMFTNAGMNQFKDIFLGNSKAQYPRVANTQKCLRVTGKHNDLEEVGHDTYHHTMFEMLGNWSFGDFFKKEAIDWAWEFLTGVLGLEKSRLYATIFEGDEGERLLMDGESFDFWGAHLESSRILKGSKKDNFWEMGETGPCGPCSEIHIDLRPDPERSSLPAQELINKGHPLVIELWNLVFIQFNRKSDGSLAPLPQKHVDTGLGFERLCMAVQGKYSNYDTDIFIPIIDAIADITGKKYGEDPVTDTAMRVVADHLRAIAFSVADGQVPSNNKAGYVIRRILRRAVRYAFTCLNQKEPFIYRLVPSLIGVMGSYFTELKSQQGIITSVIREEEASFLNTLETGIRLLDQMIEKSRQDKSGTISGKNAFELYDTYGFPLDLTELIVKERGLVVDRTAFEQEMQAQKNRSKQAAEVDTGDWIVLTDDAEEEFIGYDRLSAEVRITRYRRVVSRKKAAYHLVFNRTPFYAESGGQVGDNGMIQNASESIPILDTRKENDLIIHIAETLPENPSAPFTAIVNEQDRIRTANNHTATHLLHFALREVLGKHVEQKGSLVRPDGLRFDFSHFKKLTGEEIDRINQLVNRLIRENIAVDEKRAIPISEAQKMGAIALFGEKYGEMVRVIRFDDSVELCGGTHVKATGQIGYFRILRESAIAAGIRRIEAVTGDAAEAYVESQIKIISEIATEFEKQHDLVQAVKEKLKENEDLWKQVESFRRNALFMLKKKLSGSIRTVQNVQVISGKVNVDNPGELKDLAFQLKSEHPNLYLLLGAGIGGKAHLALMISENLITDYDLNASEIIRRISGEIKGGGGGQPFFATAGGKEPEGIDRALNLGIRILEERLS
ncbi:MAG: alanine--tRNA ligase [Bacteroidales bacterium]|nr:alanine--tRNA ligase [Bacteroidales bacterium]